jgi:hypothetical protein
MADRPDPVAPEAATKHLAPFRSLPARPFPMGGSQPFPLGQFTPFTPTRAFTPATAAAPTAGTGETTPSAPTAEQQDRAAKAASLARDGRIPGRQALRAQAQGLRQAIAAAPGHQGQTPAPAPARRGSAETTGAAGTAPNQYPADPRAPMPGPGHYPPNGQTTPGYPPSGAYPAPYPPNSQAARGYPPSGAFAAPTAGLPGPSMMRQLAAQKMRPAAAGRPGGLMNRVLQAAAATNPDIAQYLSKLQTPGR